MAYYIGTTPQDVLDGFIKRYFYGLRRNNDGELFFVAASAADKVSPYLIQNCPRSTKTNSAQTHASVAATGEGTWKGKANAKQG